MASSVTARSGTSNMSRSGRSILSAISPSTWMPSGKAKCSGIGSADGPTSTETAVVAEEQPDLLEQVAAEQRRPGDRRGIDARPGDVAVGQARVDLGVGRRLDQDFGIGRAHPPAQALVS